MIFAIASQGSAVSAMVDVNFGRCPFFCIYDTEKEVTSFIENKYAEQQNTAGVDAVEMLKHHNVKTVVAGQYGIKAMNSLRSSGIQMVVIKSEASVNEIIQRIKNKKQ